MSLADQLYADQLYANQLYADQLYAAGYGGRGKSSMALPSLRPTQQRMNRVHMGVTKGRSGVSVWGMSSSGVLSSVSSQNS